MATKQSNYLAKCKITMLRPHIVNVVSKEFTKAITKEQESKDFQLAMEDYLSTDEYSKLLDSFGGEISTEDIVNTIELLVNTFYNEDEDNFSNFVRNILTNQLIRDKYHITYLPEMIWQDGTIMFDKDSYLEQVANVIDSAIDKSIENHQKVYANHVLNFNTYFSYDQWAYVDAILATAQTNDIDDLTQYVLNNLDFSAIIRRK